MLRCAIPGLTCGLVVAVLAACANESRKPSVTAAELEDAPLTISVSTVGDFAKGHSWHMSVNSAGQAELTIEILRKYDRLVLDAAKE